MKRVKYFDVLRVISFCFIIFYHMMIQLYFDGMFDVSYVNPYFSNVNMHIATLAVAVFFMLSGAGLAISTYDKINYKQFYIKRFVKLLIPYYIVNIIYAIYKLIKYKTLGVIIIAGIPKWRLILTVLGIDGWLQLYKVQNFNQGIGEWFLGCLLILYVLFPIFRLCMKKNPYVFLGITGVIYFVIIIGNFSITSIWLNIFIKGFEFILGMYLGLYWNKINRKWMIITIPVVIYFFIAPWKIPIPDGFKITIFALAFFITFSFAEPLFQKHDLKIITLLSGCSYELFLIHHVIIQQFTPFFKPYVVTKWWVIPLFLIQIAIMAAITPLVKLLSDKAVQWTTKKLL